MRHSIDQGLRSGNKRQSYCGAPIIPCCDELLHIAIGDELLNGEICYSMKELRVLAERGRVHSNTIRPHSSLGYRPPAPQTRMTNNKGHGEVETASRFPLLHPPEGDYLNSEIAALY